MVTVKNYIRIKILKSLYFLCEHLQVCKNKGYEKSTIDGLTVKWMPPTSTVGSKFILSTSSLQVTLCWAVSCVDKHCAALILFTKT